MVYNQGFGRIAFLLEAQGENYFLAFSSFQGHPHSSACDSRQQLNPSNPCFLCRVSFSGSNPLPPSFKDICDDLGPPWRIQEYLPSSQSLITKSLLPCKVTRSQVSGIRPWTPLRDHCFATMYIGPEPRFVDSQPAVPAEPRFSLPHPPSGLLRIQGPF